MFLRFHQNVRLDVLIKKKCSSSSAKPTFWGVLVGISGASMMTCFIQVWLKHGPVILHSEDLQLLFHPIRCQDCQRGLHMCC